MAATTPITAILVVTSVTVMEAPGTTHDTAATTSVPLPPPPPPSATRRIWWALPTLTVAWSLMLVMLVSAVVQVRLWEIAPGSAEAVAPRMTFGEEARRFVEVHESGGDVMFVTALGSRLTLLDVVAAALDDDVEVLTFEERFGSSTPTRQRAVNARAMVSSKQIAEFVALSRLGIESEIVFGEVVVDDVVCEPEPSPRSACLVLVPDETIVSLDGVATPTLPELIEIVSARRAGDIVRLGVRVADSTDVVERVVELIAAPDGSGRTIIGILPRDTRTVRTPFEVGIDTDSIGGPSAGLAFTLALLDELSRGSLTGDVKVAATGTINGDESVGSVGAILQKAIAARESGAKLFLIPADQSADDLAAARRVGGNRMRVETVATLQDALDILRGLGGDPLPDATNSQ